MIKILGAAALAVALVAFPGAAAAQSASSARIEGHLGYDSLPQYRPATQEGGLLYGVGAGYDFDLGGFVVGPEVNVDFSNVRASFPSSATFPSYRVRQGRDIELSLRAGYRVAPPTLLYVKAGYDNSRYTVTTTTGKRGSGDEGLRLGIGLQQDVAGRGFVKAEYRFTNYGRLLHPDKYSSRNQILGGVGVRF